MGSDNKDMGNVIYDTKKEYPYGEYREFYEFLMFADDEIPDEGSPEFAEFVREERELDQEELADRIKAFDCEGVFFTCRTVGSGFEKETGVTGFACKPEFEMPLWAVAKCFLPLYGGMGCGCRMSLDEGVLTVEPYLGQRFETVFEVRAVGPEGAAALRGRKETVAGMLESLASGGGAQCKAIELP